MPIKVVTAPSSYPVTLAEAKDFARISVSDDDAMVTALIVTATEHAEHFTGQRFVTQTIDVYLDGFPYPEETIYIPGPVQSVTSITYTDADGVVQTLHSTYYMLDNVSNPARLAPSYDNEWPETLSVQNSVTVRAAVGGAVATCPESVKTFIKAYVAHVYDGVDGNPGDKYAALLSVARREFAA